MALAIASTQQHVYRRNYDESKWQPVGTDTNGCRVQVAKNSGEFYFKISFKDPVDNTVVKKEYHLSQESKMHFSNGFVQVPIRETKELFGIKFSNPLDGETFYGRVTEAMGQSWCDQKTGIGPDELPKPYTTFNMGGGQSPRTNIKIVRNPDDINSSLPVNYPQASQSSKGPEDGVMRSPHLQRPLKAGTGDFGGVDGFDRNEGMVGGFDLHHGGGRAHVSGGFDPHHGRGSGFYQQINGGGRMFDHQPGSDGGRFDQWLGPDNGRFDQRPGPYNGRFDQRPGPDNGRFDQRPGPNNGRFDQRPGPDGGRFDQWPGANDDDRRFDRGGGRGFNQRPGSGGREFIRPREYGEHGQHGGRFGGNYLEGGEGHLEGRGRGYPPHAEGQPVQVQPAWVPNEGRDPSRNQTMQVRPSSKPNLQHNRSPNRQPIPLKKEDLSNVVNSLTGAINSRDKDYAITLLNALLSSETTLGSVSINLKDPIKNIQKEKTFVLHIIVEFQLPRKNPMPIFLYARESDTIDILQTQVQMKFFIPKASQNWIIGDTLVISKDDLQKTLKDFGISGDSVCHSQVKVYMYVMHTKKANVSKEEFEMVRARQIQQRKEQQGQSTPAFFGQAVPPDQRNFHQAGDYHHQQHGGGDPMYDVIGNRGYGNQAPRSYVQNQTDVVYSQILHGSGPKRPGDVLTRNPPPNSIPGMVNEMYHPNAPAQMEFRDQRQYFGPPRNQRGQPPPHRNVQEILGFPSQLQNPSLGPNRVEPLKKEGWQCKVCTYFNNPHRPGCEMCSAERPIDYVVPANVPLDDAMLKAQENERLFNEFTRQEKERQAREAEENYRKYLDTDAGEAVTNKEPFECIICYTPVEVGEGIILRGCLHEFCKECLNGAVVNSPEPEVKCPFDNGDYVCGAVISEREIRAVVSDEELEALYRKGLRQAESAAANSFHCRTANCEGFCFYEDEVNEFNCPICTKKNCLLCKAIHEGMNCQEYQDDLKRRAANDEAAMETQKMLEELVKKGDAMYCPKCNIIVQKKDGCDWIRCIMCRMEICWATKGPRWGPGGHGDTSGGCKCRVGGKKCTPLCRNCH